SDTHGNDLGSRVLVLINGQRAATGNLAMIMLDSVERVEIIRGPASLQYGSAAMGGVINVITKKGQDGITAKAELGFGSFGTFKGLAAFSGRQAGFDFSAAYSHSKSEDYKDGHGRKYDNTGLGRNDTVNTSLGYTINDLHRFGAEFNYANFEDVGNPGGLTWLTPTETMDKTNKSARFSYNGGTPGGDWSWSAVYTYSEDKRLYKYPLGNYNSIYNVKADQVQTQVNFKSGPVRLTAGWDFNGYKLDEYDTNSLADRMKADYDNSAFFLIGKLLLLDERLILSAGGRYDEYKIKITGQNTNKEHNTAPSFGIAFLPIPELKFRANYSKGFRMPATGELLGYPQFMYFGNMNLKPEKSETFEFGFDLAYEHADLSFSYYMSTHKDFITTVEGPQYVYNYVNWENEIERNGIEVEASLDAAGIMGLNFELRPYINYNLMTKYHDKVTGYKIPFVPSFTVGYGLRYVHPAYNLSAQLNFSYMGPEYRDTAETQRNSGYTVASLSARKRVLDFADKGYLDIKAEVLNLFDRYYESVMTYPSPGRSFLVAVSYNY
ncbi:MAG: TonB-dependent receptor, partial [Deltaproteobacteria bacterium]|nr:TonB-dependent receptor [Deltaproteobacteria bacterium]